MNEIANTLHTLLAHNIVYFTFRKVNGEIRHAVGTRNLDFARIHTGEDIPNPKGPEHPYSYYDVEKMGWRSYKPENIISIDRVNDFDYATSEPIKQTKKPELSKREIPISRPADVPADTDNVPKGLDLGKIFRGFGGGVPQGEIRKAMDKLNKDIDLVPPMGGGFGSGFGSPISGGEGGKVGTPYNTSEGVALPIGNIPIEVFAKMVARYVVEEFIERLK